MYRMDGSTMLTTTATTPTPTRPGGGARMVYPPACSPISTPTTRPGLGAMTAVAAGVAAAGYLRHSGSGTRRRYTARKSLASAGGSASTTGFRVAETLVPAATVSIVDRQGRRRPYCTISGYELRLTQDLGTMGHSFKTVKTGTAKGTGSCRTVVFSSRVSWSKVWTAG